MLASFVSIQTLLHCLIRNISYQFITFVYHFFCVFHLLVLISFNKFIAFIIQTKKHQQHMRTQLEAHKVPFDVIDVAQDSDALIHTSNFLSHIRLI